MPVIDIVRILVVSLCAFGAGAAIAVAHRFFHTHAGRAVAASYTVLLAMVAIEQASRVGEGGPTWRIWMLALALALAIPALVAMLRGKVDFYGRG